MIRLSRPAFAIIYAAALFVIAASLWTLLSACTPRQCVEWTYPDNTWEDNNPRSRGPKKKCVRWE